MEEKNKVMKLIIWYNNKGFVIPYKEGLTLEEIKKQCQTNFKLEEEDINNLILLFNDNDGGKIIINNIKEFCLLKFGINKFNSSIELILEINQEIKILNSNNIFKNIMSNTNNDEYDKLIIELKNEIGNLKNKCNNYEKRIKELLLKCQQNIKNEIKKEKKLCVIENENFSINNLKSNQNDINKKEKKILTTKDMKFINIECNKCKKKNYIKIFQCVACENYYLCQNCHNENNIKTLRFHEHKYLYFFEIIFPVELMKLIIKKEEKVNIYNKTIEKFNKF